MQTSNRLLDDLAKVASGAASAVAGIRQEVDVLVRQRLERLVADFDLVTREEFEAVRATAANARAEQEALAERIARLEERVDGAEAPTPAPPAEAMPSGPEAPGGRA
ncbi:MAG: accessory factor UbiK family protein [Rhodospirillales bacterium]|nr:MAG: accessory factor UbiK family protein [Rhodospirillales bacterium]